MAEPQRPDPDEDCFRPPAIPTEVFCLHCRSEYESYLIHWVEETIDGRIEGFWCCPTPGCGGKGFGFDIFPTDPEWTDPEGRLHVCWSDDDGDFDESDDELANEFDDEFDEDFDAVTEFDQLELDLGLDPAPPHESGGPGGSGGTGGTGGTGGRLRVDEQDFEDDVPF